MKKLLMMIFMLVVTLPAYAAEVTLKCDLTDKQGRKIEKVWKFDESTGNARSIDDEPRNVKDKCKGDAPCFEYDITDTHVQRRFWMNGKFYPDQSTSISRMDGTYTNSDLTGRCVPFKQNF